MSTEAMNQPRGKRVFFIVLLLVLGVFGALLPTSPTFAASAASTSDQALYPCAEAAPGVEKDDCQARQVTLREACAAAADGGAAPGCVDAVREACMAAVGVAWDDCLATASVAFFAAPEAVPKPVNENSSKYPCAEAESGAEKELCLTNQAMIRESCTSDAGTVGPGCVKAVNEECADSSSETWSECVATTSTAFVESMRPSPRDTKAPAPEKTPSAATSSKPTARATYGPPKQPVPESLFGDTPRQVTGTWIALGTSGVLALLLVYIVGFRGRSWWRHPENVLPAVDAANEEG